MASGLIYILLVIISEILQATSGYLSIRCYLLVHPGDFVLLGHPCVSPKPRGLAVSICIFQQIKGVNHFQLSASISEWIAFGVTTMISSIPRYLTVVAAAAAYGVIESVVIQVCSSQLHGSSRLVGASVSNGSNPLEGFPVRIGTGTEPLQRFYHMNNPDCSIWARFLLKTQPLQAQIFRSN